MTIHERLAQAVETYNTTPARNWAASKTAKANVTRLRNQIAKQEAEAARPRISMVSATPRSPQHRASR